MPRLTPDTDDDALVPVPSKVIADGAAYDALLAQITKLVDAQVPDLSTPKGRDAIKSLAYKIVRTKTALDGAGKDLTEEWRARTDAVNAIRRRVRDDLDALASRARKPLDDWEQHEAQRVQGIAIFFDSIRAAQIVNIDETAADVLSRLGKMRDQSPSLEQFQDRHEEAVALLDQTRTHLEQAHRRLVQEEADRAELAKLRAAEEERQRLAAEEERKRVEDEEAKAAEERAAAERDRIAKEAAAKAKKDAEDAAAQKLAEERAAHQREIERRDQEQRDRDAEAQRQRDEDDARAKDEEHRARIIASIRLAILGLKVDNETADRIISAIVAGEVPGLKIEF